MFSIAGQDLDIEQGALITTQAGAERREKRAPHGNAYAAPPRVSDRFESV